MNENRFLHMEQQLRSQKEGFPTLMEGNRIVYAKTNNFPSPATIMSNYPSRYQPDGSLSDYCSQAGNECAIRMSIALQKSGITGKQLEKSGKFRKTHQHSSSKVVHQPSAAAMADWLHSALKYPKKMVKSSGQWTKSDFAGKSGILYFAHSHRGGDGPGHIDVLLNGKTGSGFYNNRVIWFWEFKNNSWFSTSSGKSIDPDHSRQFSPGLFGIAGLEAVEAITLGLTAVQMGASAAQRTGNLSYQPVAVTRLMEKEPQPFSKSFTHELFGASIGTPIGKAATVIFEVRVKSNDFGEISAYITHNLKGSTSFEYSSMNVTFTNLGMHPVKGGEKDPRAWPIRVAYQGQYDPWGNGKFDFQGEFEFNAFGYFKVLDHKVVSRSFADWAIFGKIENVVFKRPNKTHYIIPKLPEAQRKILMQRYKKDKHYKGN